MLSAHVAGVWTAAPLWIRYLTDPVVGTLLNPIKPHPSPVSLGCCSHASVTIHLPFGLYWVKEEELCVCCGGVPRTFCLCHHVSHSEEVIQLEPSLLPLALLVLLTPTDRLSALLQALDDNMATSPPKVVVIISLWIVPWRCSIAHKCRCCSYEKVISTSNKCRPGITRNQPATQETSFLELMNRIRMDDLFRNQIVMIWYSLLIWYSLIRKEHKGVEMEHSFDYNYILSLKKVKLEKGLFF